MNDATSDLGSRTGLARKRLSEIIYEDLKHRIQRGSISSEERLQEDNLTKDHRTSRTPIRDSVYSYVRNTIASISRRQSRRAFFSSVLIEKERTRWA